MIETLVGKYCRAASGTACLADAVDGTLDPAVASKCTHDMREYFSALRQSEEGRQAITALMAHDNPRVRLWAAAHSLEWAPQAAQAMLEEERDGGGPVSFEAKWTLREYHRKGHLSFGPPGRRENDAPDSTQE